jgi:hypothetical protein
MNRTPHDRQEECGGASAPTFIAVVLHIYGGKGHVLSYHKAVEEAVRLNGWSHVAVISPDPNIIELPGHWRVEYIDSGVLDYEGVAIKRLVKGLRFWPFIKGMYTLSASFARVLRNENKESRNDKIVFLESFNPLQLISIAISFFFTKRDTLSVWLMYRGGPDWGGPKHRLMARTFAVLFRAINPVFQWLVGKDNLVLLTDSEILSTSLPVYYKLPVHLVPIPHTPHQPANNARDKKSIDGITCWWPGAPRPDKGYDIVRRLAALDGPHTQNVTLVVAKSASLASKPRGVRIEQIEDRLEREEYERRFFSSTFILLPYDRDIYRESTSGIFTECVAAGAIPLVSEGTWMAYELNKWNLSELVLDWEDDQIFKEVVRIAADPSVNERMRAMQVEYLSFHNTFSYAQSIGSLYKALPLHRKVSKE